MDEQEKGIKEETSDTEVQVQEQEQVQEQVQEQEQTQPQTDQVEKLKETTEKIWGSTVHAWSTATSKANQYKKLVQKKIDISALHKKINLAHSDLGKLVDDLREEGKKNILNLSEVKEVLTRLDDLKAEAATLEEEVEQIKAEEPPKNPHEEEKASE